MALTSLMRTVWSARLQYNLRKQLVYANLTNSDYEGDTTNASVVKINQISGASIGDYDLEGGLGTPERLNSISQDLILDQRKYYNFMVDDLDKAQTNIEIVDNAMSETAFSLADIVDQYVAGFHTSVNLSNQLGSDAAPIFVGRDAADKTAYDQIVDLGVCLDDNNVPRPGRYVIVPGWYIGLLAKDARFTSNPTILANGLVQGQSINGAQVYLSNNTPNTSGSKFKIISGNAKAVTFADGIQRMERYRPEKFFADAVRGLYVYGAKVLNPKAMTVLTASKGSM